MALVASCLACSGAVGAAAAETTVARIEGTVTGTDGRRIEAFMPLPDGEELALSDGALLVLFHEGTQVNLRGPATGSLAGLLEQVELPAGAEEDSDDLIGAALRALADWMFTDESTVAIAGIRGSDAAIQPLLYPPSGWIAPDLLDAPLELQVDTDALGTRTLRLVALDGNGDETSWNLRIGDGRARIPEAALTADRVEIRVTHEGTERRLATWQIPSTEDQHLLASALERIDRDLGAGYECSLLRASVFAGAGCFHQAAEALDEALALAAGRPEAERANLQPWSPITLQLGAQWRNSRTSADWRAVEPGSSVPSGAGLSFTPHSSWDAHLTLLARGADGSWQPLISGWLSRYGLAVDPPAGGDVGNGAREVLASIGLDLDDAMGPESLLFLVSHLDLGLSHKNLWTAEEITPYMADGSSWYRRDGRHQGQGFGTAWVRVDFEHVARR